MSSHSTLIFFCNFSPSSAHNAPVCELLIILFEKFGLGVIQLNYVDKKLSDMNGIVKRILWTMVGTIVHNVIRLKKFIILNYQSVENLCWYG